ncbi:hypothetical protein [Castellaniella caeni]|uniref:hypothetical protein n=1 Tax=Castellaniella caeni TaxID=266123 RepID=UPI0008323B27|nr:hypothetical protein [Castellaniella caeni]
MAYAESCQAFKAAQAELAGVPVLIADDAPKLADRWAADVMAHWAEDAEAINEYLAITGDTKRPASEYLPDTVRTGAKLLTCRRRMH